MNVNALAADIGSALIENDSPPAIVLIVNNEGGVSMLGFGFADESEIADTFQAIAKRATESTFHTVN